MFLKRRLWHDQYSTRSRCRHTEAVVQSKTIWLNLVSALLMALELKFDLLQPILPGNVYALLAVAITVANGVLRVVTAAPLTFGFKAIK